MTSMTDRFHFRARSCRSVFSDGFSSGGAAPIGIPVPGDTRATTVQTSGNVNLSTANGGSWFVLGAAGSQTVTVSAGVGAADEEWHCTKTGSGRFDVVAGAGSPELIPSPPGALTGIPSGGSVTIKRIGLSSRFIVVGTRG